MFTLKISVMAWHVMLYTYSVKVIFFFNNSVNLEWWFVVGTAQRCLLNAYTTTTVLLPALQLPLVFTLELLFYTTKLSYLNSNSNSERLMDIGIFILYSMLLVFRLFQIQITLHIYCVRTSVVVNVTTKTNKVKGHKGDILKLTKRFEKIFCLFCYSSTSSVYAL